MAQQQGRRQGNQDLSRHLAEGKQNEEGFLEIAFHPKFKENGQFFVFYTNADMANVVSRFRVKKDDPNSEEETIRFEKPFWNHDSGTILFGPDEHLYITHGDGSNGGDPKETGQNQGTWLGKVLRINARHGWKEVRGG